MEALDTARDVKTHPYSSFPIMHLAPSKRGFEGDFTAYLISPRALPSETDHIPPLAFKRLLCFPLMATKAAVICCFFFFLKKCLLSALVSLAGEDKHR